MPESLQSIGFKLNYIVRSKYINAAILATSIQFALLVGCSNTGTAELSLFSCLEGRIHQKVINDTSSVWKKVAEDLHKEPHTYSFDPKHYNYNEQYYWGQNVDTTLWLILPGDTVVRFEHLHMDSAFERFYGSWYDGDSIKWYSISHSMRNLALQRIRKIQSNYHDSIYPEGFIGNIYANDSCTPKFPRRQTIH